MRIRTIIPKAFFGAAAIVMLTAAAARELVVYVSDGGFSQTALTMARGDRLRFTVRDKNNHQVWKRSGSSAGDIPPTVLEGKGASVTITVADAGSYAYVDRLNPERAALRLTVKP